MSSGIFVIQNDGQLVEMQPLTPPSEDILQKLLADYPSLLIGDQIDSLAPRRWLLISREAPLPTEQDSGPRWSVDHLFLDQDAIPTVVEVKRASDTRIRREVVGQMLDYAANAIVYWPIEALRTQYELSCQGRGIDPEQQLTAFLNSSDIDQFWQQAKTNLQAGRVRLIFVADEIPAELRRIVEFLNRQMSPAEVLAVEIRQFAGQGLKTLVPQVIGQTAETQQRKTQLIAPGKRWEEKSFFQELRTKRGTDEWSAARKLYDWALVHHLRSWWGKGAKDGSYYPMLDYQGTTHWLFSVWTYGRVYIQFQYQQKPFDSEPERLELAGRLNEISGITIPPSAITKQPVVMLNTLTDESVLRQFLMVFDWVIDRIRAA